MNGEKANVKDVQKDVNEIKADLRQNLRAVVHNIEDLNELDKRAQRLRLLGNDMKIEAAQVRNDTKCCKPWMIKTIIIVTTIMTLALVYVILSILRCGDLNITCQKE